ncbi:hypothetical protein LOK49_LG06G01774 [Camellia lanceoleosa]|uniref:Uncharacterized protein n=1 Tax=Camellia lanceoleosa TaxID=1840588 RepID=A0ACC0HE55_9ERIC|nr:hypothetical protein LOK49_LG06G01774 [Camellia lanceoleosa]
MGGPSRSESQSAMKDNAVVSDVLTIPTVQPQKCGLANDGRISSGADKGPKEVLLRKSIIRKRSSMKSELSS